MPFRLTSPVVKLSENDVEKQCLGYLKLKGYLIRRLHVGRAFWENGEPLHLGEAGTPDYVAVHERHPGFFLEVKRPGGSLNADQERWIWVHKQGYRVAIAVVDRLERTDPGKLESLSAWLQRHESQT